MARKLEAVYLQLGVPALPKLEPQACECAVNRILAIKALDLTAGNLLL